MGSELHDIEYMTQYLSDGYKNAYAKKKRDDDDRTYTGSINALGTLGMAGAIALGTNGNRDQALRTAAGVSGAVGGYHLSRILHGSPGVNLLVAAITGATLYGVEPYITTKG